MRRHSIGLFLGAASFLLVLPMTIFAYQGWSRVFGYAAVAVMFVASIAFGPKSMATTRNAAIWLVGEVGVGCAVVYVFARIWLSS